MGEPAESSVSEGRNHFSDLVNRAAYAGEVTYITRGRSRTKAAAVVPAAWVDEYDALLDAEDARIAAQQLADIRSGKSTPIPAEQLYRELGI